MPESVIGYATIWAAERPRLRSHNAGIFLAVGRRTTAGLQHLSWWLMQSKEIVVVDSSNDESASKENHENLSTRKSRRG